jgi:iron(III) transport system ATP-binding protein
LREPWPWNLNLDANLREEMRFEIRRLHNELRYTTIYVTHDQGEAMTTADRIVVMNRGRVEQIGSPEEVYERPTCEFVARFLGGANILYGKVAGDAVCCGTFTLRCANQLPDSRVVPVAIRPHRIELHRTIVSPTDPNTVQATVRRHTYLGTLRDYLVVLDGGTELRVAAPIDTIVAPGEKVMVRLPPEYCRALSS